MRITRFFVVLLALAAIAAFFLPYFVFNNAGQQPESGYEETGSLEGFNITPEEAAKPSLFTIVKGYFQREKANADEEAVSVFYIILYCLIPFFGFLIFLFGLTGLPVPALIFSALLGGTGVLIRWDFGLRSAIPSPTFSFGIGYYMIFICTVLLFAASICGIAEKRRRRRWTGK